MHNKGSLQDISINLHHWFREREYRGIDPYQLDEKYFGAIKRFGFLKYVRKALKPLHPFIPKRFFTSPEPIYIAKALGMIIGGNALLSRTLDDASYMAENRTVFDLLLAQRNPSFKHLCWGWPFEWGQSPRFPKNTPLVCVSSPIGHCLLDWYETSGEPDILDTCQDIAAYLMEENGLTVIDQDMHCLHYSSVDNHLAYNGNCIASSFMLRLAAHRPDPDLNEFAAKCLRFVVQNQSAEGYWEYSHASGSHHLDFVDNRHTGFILEALAVANRSLADETISAALEKGKQYYMKHLFEGNIPRWSPTSTYPVDIHDVTQAVITLIELDDNDTAREVLEFCVEKLSNERDEFYFKLFKDGSVNNVVFFRWNQAWAYKALTSYLARSAT